MSVRQPVTRQSESVAIRGAGSALVQRECACGGSAGLDDQCESCRDADLTGQAKALQPKLRIGPADDHYERQADRVADAVMRMPSAGAPGFSIESITPLVQRQPENEEEEGEEALQMKRAPLRAETAAAGLAGTTGSPGRPLPASERLFFESRLGFDFSGVRVHTGSNAAVSARAVRARAYTIGRNVVFGAGQWSPGTERGRRLIAHELTHVIQQGRNPTRAAHVRSNRGFSWLLAGERGSRISTPRRLDRNALATPGSDPARIIQRENGETGAGSTSRDEEYRLHWPGMRQSPLWRPTLAPRLELRIDPEIQAQIAAMRMMNELLNPESIRSSLFRIDFDTLLSAQQPPWLTASTRPSPAPLVPRGAGPSSPRAGTGGDVLRAIMRIPSVDTALTRIRTQAADHLRRDWRRLSTGGRALLITQSALISGSALAGVLSSAEARDFALGLIQNRDLPIPGVPGLTFQFNATGRNRFIRFDLNVGALLPSSFGFR